MYFSLSKYMDATRELTVFSRADKTGFNVSLVGSTAHKLLSALWKVIYRPRLANDRDGVDPLFYVPPPLAPEHTANCKVYPDRLAMLASLEKGKTWAEVGTFKGEFASKILEICQPKELELIDVTFDRVRANPYVVPSNVVRFNQGDSATLLATYPDEHFDYIYIDANHDLFAVARDAVAAIPKLKPDGLMIFNDYVFFSHSDMEPYGVVQVVNSLCVEGGWEMVGFALQYKMYCDVAVRRRKATEQRVELVQRGASPLRARQLIDR